MTKKPSSKVAIEQRDPQFDPRYCTYRLSRKIRDHVDKLSKADNVDQATKSILCDIMDEDETNKNVLTYESLVKLHKYIARADQNYSEPFYIFSEDCKCMKPKPRDNKALDDRLKQLRLRSSQAMYDEMTSSVDRNSESKVERLADGSDGQNLLSKDGSNVSEFKMLNGSLVAVFNSFLVFICTFIFFFKALEYSLPQPNIIAQVACGLTASTVVGIAELYYIARVI